MAFLALTACGADTSTKEFFKSFCGSKDKSVKFEKVSEKDDDDDKAEPSPTPYDYGNRCSEADKRQLLADENAKQLRSWADNEQKYANYLPTPAEVAVSYERATKDCAETIACSGLSGLSVFIPPGEKKYGCYIRNGDNYSEVWCRMPKKDDQ
jgi:hypothetical protein